MVALLEGFCAEQLLVCDAPGSRGGASRCHQRTRKMAQNTSLSSSGYQFGHGFWGCVAQAPNAWSDLHVQAVEQP
eukprot:11008057-Alexandrium_andersonii.AAC.1